MSDLRNKIEKIEKELFNLRNKKDGKLHMFRFYRRRKAQLLTELNKSK